MPASLGDKPVSVKGVDGDRRRNVAALKARQPALARTNNRLRILLDREYGSQPLFLRALDRDGKIPLIAFVPLSRRVRPFLNDREGRYEYSESDRGRHP